jgi:hypothetical protein
MVITFSLTLFAAQVALGQTTKQSDDRDTMQALLAEVRSLRQVLQDLHELSLDTNRGRLLMDRIQAGRENIRRLNVTLDETRATLEKTQGTVPRFIERQKLLESHAQLEVDQRKRAEMELEAREIKQSVERYKSMIEPLKEREQQLLTELQNEKAKLAELETRLDRLEGSIENDRLKLAEEKAKKPRQ